MSYMEEVMQSAGNDFDVCMGVAHSGKFENLLEKYDSFLDDMMNGTFGSTACFWAIYVYFINRVYRSLERAVRTNNVSEYLKILPLVVEIFFALNRPNYARWGSLFLNKLQHLDPAGLRILEAGAFSIRRTDKSFSRCAIESVVRTNN